ncbi:DNA binding protein, nucleoid-associated [Variovorax sp. SRS16]|uniref:H-NS family nucleoid-associated regulatory protein n=1 Tax=Variovorax sp. SRS16 TaxID=282217 RepID=UPI0013182D16|nr:H-NS family nucleoid-associated regulatory protein [Variovorax sp. SRS16]VTU23896.1 DNA binding protein, nucleoid-associated [Variovorax sp. SRS16]
MTQSYKQIQRQIEALQQQAEKLKKKEVGGVIGRIKEAIAHYGLTADQLFGGKSGGSKSKAAKAVAVAPQSAKYADGQGNAWSGRGPRPHWLRDALKAGRALDEFATAGSSPAKTTRSAAKASKAKKPKAKYRDQAGNSWSGMGPRPRWLKEAMAAGKSLEELTA